MRRSFLVGFSFVASLLAACVGDAPVTTPVADAGDAGPGTDGGDAAPDAAPPKPEWSLALTGRTTITSIAVELATGDVFIGGSAKGAVPELGIAGTTNDGEDWLVARIEGKSGKVLWAKTYGGPADDRVTSIALNAGAVYAVGITYGTQMTFTGATTGATLNLPSTTATPTQFATMSAVARIDANGGTPSWAVSPDAAETAATNHRSLCTKLAWGQQLHVLCQYQGSKFGVGNTFAPPQTGALVGQPAVLQFNSLGAMPRFDRAFEGTNALAAALAVDASGNVYVGGTAGPVLYERPGSNAVYNNGLTLNGFLLRFPESTTTGMSGVYVTSQPSMPGNAAFSDVIVDPAGVTAVGQFGGNIQFGGGGGILTSGGTKDGFLMRLPPDLSSPTFAKRIGGGNEDRAWSVARSTTGTPALWVAGDYFSNDFIFGSTTYPIPATNTHQGLLVKSTDVGSPISGSTFVSLAGNASVNAVASDDAHGFLFAAGNYDGGVTLDDGTKATSKSDSAGFIVRRKL